MLKPLVISQFINDIRVLSHCAVINKHEIMG